MSSCEEVKQVYLQSNHSCHSQYNSAISSYQINHNVTIIKQNLSSQQVIINDKLKKSNIIELKLLKNSLYEQSLNELESSKLIINIIHFDLKQS